MKCLRVELFISDAAMLMGVYCILQWVGGSNGGLHKFKEDLFPYLGDA